MDIKNIERLVEQMVNNNEKKGGPVSFIVDDTEISKGDFASARGFLPLLFMSATALDKMNGSGETLWTKGFELKENVDSMLSFELEGSSELENTPLSPLLLSMSAGVELMLDPENNPYITTEDGVRKVDVVSMVSDLSSVSNINVYGNNGISVNSSALESLAQREETPDMPMNK